ncbi:MAG: nicotinate-nucleotide adenylyltransferase [Candidatus Hydrogenedentota bacterium]
MNPHERIGIFGGTFDPIHIAHVAIARCVQQEANLDRVLFTVAAEPPHKRGDFEATAVQRFAMVEAALRDEADLEPCDLELHREGPSYSADTLAILREKHPNAELFLIMGLDSLLDLPNWYQPERIIEYANILAVARPGYMDVIPDTLADHTRVIAFDESPVSSTSVRNRLQNGAIVDDLICPAVSQVIQEAGLYGC